ncbi:hypothetical protein SNOG_02388 [Parastagonospora nodorum SN15]|uniref:Uncharacterized protein n=1 Tax=Phaeosphaeria nodorum (strain SN15 / ATCC MYA-4574 / FGSC 10173) TaxID=321614 RepID=Q0V0S6_PHANO|nr:hypothetical protein SNOG_02388 [Parastagonospora nodorum SN15]EAT90600.1 hypothetical protein SNOG_02388 [Parastagonospora nodorum SN15]
MGLSRPVKMRSVGPVAEFLTAPAPEVASRWPSQRPALLSYHTLVPRNSSSLLPLHGNRLGSCGRDELHAETMCSRVPP